MGTPTEPCLPVRSGTLKRFPVRRRRRLLTDEERAKSRARRLEYERNYRAQHFGMTDAHDAIAKIGADLGAEVVLAAYILHQARRDAEDVTAGKPIRINEWGAIGHAPVHSLREFFHSDWFNTLVDGIGQEPELIRRRMLHRLPKPDEGA